MMLRGLVQRSCHPPFPNPYRSDFPTLEFQPLHDSKCGQSHSSRYLTPDRGTEIFSYLVDADK